MRLWPELSVNAFFATVSAYPASGCINVPPHHHFTRRTSDWEIVFIQGYWKELFCRLVKTDFALRKPIPHAVLIWGVKSVCPSKAIFCFLKFFFRLHAKPFQYWELCQRLFLNFLFLEQILLKLLTFPDFSSFSFQSGTISTLDSIQGLKTLDASVTNLCQMLEHLSSGVKNSLTLRKQ